MEGRKTTGTRQEQISEKLAGEMIREQVLNIDFHILNFYIKMAYAAGFDEGRKLQAKSKMKAVIRYGNDKEKEYTSIRQAARENNLSATRIVRVLKGDGKTANGYKWRYKDE